MKKRYFSVNQAAFINKKFWPKINKKVISKKNKFLVNRSKENYKKLINYCISLFRKESNVFLHYSE